MVEISNHQCSIDGTKNILTNNVSVQSQINLNLPETISTMSSNLAKEHIESSKSSNQQISPLDIQDINATELTNMSIPVLYNHLTDATCLGLPTTIATDSPAIQIPEVQETSPPSWQYPVIDRRVVTCGCKSLSAEGADLAAERAVYCSCNGLLPEECQAEAEDDLHERQRWLDQDVQALRYHSLISDVKSYTFLYIMHFPLNIPKTYLTLNA